MWRNADNSTHSIKASSSWFACSECLDKKLPSLFCFLVYQHHFLGHNTATFFSLWINQVALRILLSIIRWEKMYCSIRIDRRKLLPQSPSWKPVLFASQLNYSFTNVTPNVISRPTICIEERGSKSLILFDSRSFWGRLLISCADWIHFLKTNLILFIQFCQIVCQLLQPISRKCQYSQPQSSNMMWHKLWL